ncbi:MAG: hypothetical protein RJR34_13120 [Candidatus Methanoculleus thermohydrogenotrophicum]|nr:hypothetical protein [Candidatus Methanoculleus thermohydrogenotrophicum]
MPRHTTMPTGILRWEVVVEDLVGAAVVIVAGSGGRVRGVGPRCESAVASPPIRTTWRTYRTPPW